MISDQVITGQLITDHIIMDQIVFDNHFSRYNLFTKTKNSV